MAEPLLRVRDLAVEFVTGAGSVRALEGISFDLAPGEILGIAGESGSGKSTLGQALLRLLPPPAIITGGSVMFEGRDLFALSAEELRALRWRRLAVVFQSALDALNPVLTVAAQLQDVLEAHAPRPRAELEARARELMELVGIPVERLRSYPHELSGGMRQRVCIAMALALQPSLLVLDEPTTALDVVVEKEILRQVLELRRRLGFSVLLISHDVGRMLQVADRIAILYAGRLVELAPAAELRTRAQHPYTRKLLAAYPSLHGDRHDLASIPGTPPSLAHPPPGCRFHPRCDLAIDVCRTAEPPLEAAGEGREVACHVVGRLPR